jgi:alpha-tubulin suppressor-like RCC1 family protein
MKARWRCAFALACILGTVAAVPMSSAAGRLGLYWGYVMDSQLVLMQGTTELTSVSNYFSDIEGDPPVAWSRSGTHVAFISDTEIRGEPPEEVAVVVVDVMSTTQERYPCPSCDQLIAFSDSDFLASDGENSWVVDPDAGTVEKYGETLAWGDPKAGTPQNGSILLLGSTQTAVISRRIVADSVDILSSAQDRSGTSTVFTDRYSGYTRFVSGYGDGKGSGPTRGWYAVTYRLRPGECLQESPVVMFDEAAGNGSSVVDASAIEPFGFRFGVSAGFDTEDIWSTPGEGLWALISTWSCQTDSKGLSRRDVAVSRLAHLSDGVWNWSNGPARTGRMTQYRPLDGQNSVALTPQECASSTDPSPQYARCTGGELVLDGPSGRVLDKNVIQMFGPWTAVRQTRPASILSASVDDGLLGYEYAFQLVATGGRPPYSWTASGLPRGLTIDPNTGRLAGVPLEAGSFKAMFGLSDAAWGSGLRSMTITVGDTRAQPLATSIFAGSAHTCALTDAGDLFCWGANSSGQLGTGDKSSSSVARPVVGLPAGVTGVAAGTSHTCALLLSGDVYCWGDNSSGELGFGNREDSLTPIRARLPGRAVSVSAGFQRTCAVVDDGDVYCWGNNLDGALGDASEEDRSLPTRVEGLPSRATDVRTGSFYSCAATASSELWCWGNLLSQMGRKPVAPLGRPQRLEGVKKVRSVAISQIHACATTQAQPIVCWGENGDGNLGNGPGPGSAIPQAVTDFRTPVQSVTIGDSLSCALTADSDVQCWGAGIAAVSGRSPEVHYTRAVEIDGLDGGVKGVAAGDNHVCALTMGGQVLCWGSNTDGELGDATTTTRARPVRVVGLG